MAGLERRKDDVLLVHLDYIRKDIKELKEEFQNTTKELKNVNSSQWDGISAVRVELDGKIGVVQTEVTDLTGKVNKQIGVTAVLAVISGAITSALVQLGLRK